jgi:hypothetical protein
MPGRAPFAASYNVAIGRTTGLRRCPWRKLRSCDLNFVIVPGIKKHGAVNPFVMYAGLQFCGGLLVFGCRRWRRATGERPNVINSRLCTKVISGETPMSEFQSQNKFQLMYSYRANQQRMAKTGSLVLLLGNALDLRGEQFSPGQRRWASGVNLLKTFAGTLC